MKKSTFYKKSWFDGTYILVQGYIENINGVEMGFYKNSRGYWCAVHIPTGWHVADTLNQAKTRKQFAEAIRSCRWFEDLQNPPYHKYVNAVVNMQEFLKTVAQ